MTPDAYSLALPEVQTTSVVFASPHSGRHYSQAFMRQSILDDRTIRSSEDAYMDELIAAAPSFGAPLLSAIWPRAYLDLNRSPDEFDPSVIKDIRTVSHNPRISSGLGVIPRVVSNGRAIYSGKLSLTEAQERINDCWKPYHARLETLMQVTRTQFGKAILIDCHSMPHEAVDAVVQPGKPRPDVVLGDRFGASASGALVEQIESIFLEAGLRVSRNAPFAGAYITQHYGRPSRGMHAVQIEVDRSLYLNEGAVTPNANFDAFRNVLSNIVGQIAEIGAHRLPLAAE